MPPIIAAAATHLIAVRRQLAHQRLVLGVALDELIPGMES